MATRRDPRSNGMMPEFVGNIVETANSLSRSVYNVAFIIEQGTEDLSEISALVMKQQKERMLSNFESDTRKLASA